MAGLREEIVGNIRRGRSGFGLGLGDDVSSSLTTIEERLVADGVRGDSGTASVAAVLRSGVVDSVGVARGETQGVGGYLGAAGGCLLGRLRGDGVTGNSGGDGLTVGQTGCVVEHIGGSGGNASLCADRD